MCKDDEFRVLYVESEMLMGQLELTSKKCPLSPQCHHLELPVIRHIDLCFNWISSFY